MRKIALALAITLALTALVLAQASVLVPGAGRPVADGTVSTGEYSWTKTLKGAVVSAALDKEGTLYLSLEAPASGWVSIGWGSMRMDGARVAIGAEAAGARNIAEMTTRGRGLAPAADSVLLSKAVAEKAGKTTLEISLPLAKAASGAQLQLIVAWSGSDNFSVKHQARDALSIPLK